MGYSYKERGILMLHKSLKTNNLKCKNSRRPSSVYLVDMTERTIAAKLIKAIRRILRMGVKP